MGRHPPTGFTLCGLERTDVLGLGTLRTLSDLELNLLVLVERAVAARRDGRVVRENVRAARVTRDDALSSAAAIVVRADII